MCRGIYDNWWVNSYFLSLNKKVAAPQRKYVEEPVFEHAEETRSPREEPTPEKDQKQRSTRRHFTYRRQPGRVVKYVQSLRWTPIPIGFGFALLAYQHYRRVIQRNSDPKFVSGVQLAKEWEVSIILWFIIETCIYLLKLESVWAVALEMFMY